MRIVVDTNIIFSAILSPNATISDLILNSDGTFDFFAPTFVVEELENHKKKLLKLTGFTEKELDYQTLTILKKIDLINLESIKHSTFEKARELANDVDEFDIPFVALALELGSPLWTGDKKLRNGLESKGVDWILLTTDLTALRN